MTFVVHRHQLSRRSGLTANFPLVHTKIELVGGARPGAQAIWWRSPRFAGDGVGVIDLGLVVSVSDVDVHIAWTCV